MAKIYRTAQGRQLDIEKLRLQNEMAPAIGNMRVNARGDQLGPGGQVVKNREQMVDEHYKNTTSTSQKRKNVGGPDDIPTKGGKSKRVEKFEPGPIEPDSIKLDAEPLEDDFVDPVIEKTQDDLPEPGPMPETDKTTGIAAGEKKLKGGLARAVAKTRDYESKKNKPKRL